MLGLVEFDTVLSQILLTAYAEKLLYNLNLIKLCSVCAKDNAAVKTTSDACSMLAVKTL